MFTGERALTWEQWVHTLSNHIKPGHIKTGQTRQSILWVHDPVERAEEACRFAKK